MVHLECSVQSYVFTYIVLNVSEIMLHLFNNSMMRLLSAIVVAESCLISSEKKRIKHIMACELLWCCCCFCLCWCTKVLQRNSYNIHRSISAIVFKLYLVYKTSYHFLRIFTIIKHILICSTAFECPTKSVVTVISP